MLINYILFSTLQNQTDLQNFQALLPTSLLPPFLHSQISQPFQLLFFEYVSLFLKLSLLHSLLLFLEQFFFNYLPQEFASYSSKPVHINLFCFWQPQHQKSFYWTLWYKYPIELQLASCLCWYGQHIEWDKQHIYRDSG